MWGIWWEEGFVGVVLADDGEGYGSIVNAVAPVAYHDGFLSRKIKIGNGSRRRSGWRWEWRFSYAAWHNLINRC